MVRWLTDWLINCSVWNRTRSSRLRIGSGRQWMVGRQVTNCDR